MFNIVPSNFRFFREKRTFSLVVLAYLSPYAFRLLESTLSDDFTSIITYFPIFPPFPIHRRSRGEGADRLLGY